MVKYKLILFIVSFVISVGSQAQSVNDVLNLLIENKTISAEQADSLRAEYSIKQQTSLPDKRLKIDFESRTRAELRNGYSQLANDTTVAAFFVNQRSRLSINFVNENKLAVQFSVQDLRVWGQQDPKYTTASTLQIYEAWVEPYITENLSVRIGRQKLSYDNQRLFAENNWRLGGVAHDALNIRYAGDKLTSELAFAFNQSKENEFGTNYAPSGFTNYKFLAVSFLKYKINKNFTLTLLNSADGYQAKGKPETLYTRYNNGGRLEFDMAPVYATFSGYYQWGKNSTGVNLDAWYIQPEVKFAQQNTSVRLGVEVFSGNTPTTAATTDHNFSPLYGSGHSFNGSLDLITKFPSEVGNAGLINPYLVLTQNIGKLFDVRVDFHTFQLKNSYIKAAKTYDKYLGFENDWLIGFKPNSFSRIDFGFSWANVTETLEKIKNAKAGSATYNPTWAYISVTFKPSLFTTIFK